LESAQPSGGDLGPGAEDGSAGDRLVGFGCALGVGLCGGSTLVPLNYVTVRTKGLVFMPSFGCGAGISAVLYALGFVLLLKQRGQPIPPMHARETLLAGLVSGLWWNISNLLSIIAIPRVGFAIAGPLLQCALFVAGLLGIFVFKEIKGPAIPVFFAAGGVLIGGAGLLSYNSG
jgi:glucose uptake protein GlcU